MNKTVIVGGGIAGLATAFYLQEGGSNDYTLIECSPRWGGKIISAQQYASEERTFFAAEYL